MTPVLEVLTITDKSSYIIIVVKEFCYLNLPILESFDELQENTA